MHIEAKNFTIFVKSLFPDYFINKTVLDVGCGDINGNNLFLFENCKYEGNDVYKGSHNVTIISKTKDLPFSNGHFDTIISTECFEHDPEYKLSWLKIYNMLKNNGLFVFTCASTDRHEHGTRRTSINDSFGTIFNIEDMQDYYKNLTQKDLNEVLDLNNSFSYWDTYYNKNSKDLYFVGIKKQIYKKYIDNGVINTSNNI